ncbi:MAG: hypothetical protein NC217_02950 [Muribaculaceae bacterium]|nr:hypothetical protein [Muribaculaceae bacterium]
MKKLIFGAILSLTTASLFVGCKPTENNYRMAYDKAMEKQREGLTDEQYALMYEESLPRYMRTPTDSVRGFSESMIWQYTPIAVDSGRKVDPAPYNLTVGKYSMLTNAKSHADNLAADGWKSYVFRNGEPIYYVIVMRSADLDSVAQAAHAYTKRYPRGTVSIPEPMVIVPLTNHHVM